MCFCCVHEQELKGSLYSGNLNHFCNNRDTDAGNAAFFNCIGPVLGLISLTSFMNETNLKFTFTNDDGDWDSRLLAVLKLVQHLWVLLVRLFRLKKDN